MNDKTFQNDCCLKYRPDFLFDCGSYFLILEVLIANIHKIVKL
jgi:hypothetical protein